MTVPIGAGEGGYDPSALDGSVVGAGLSALASRDRDTVTNQQKSKVQGNTTVSTVLDLVFDGLNSALTLPWAILEALIKRIMPGLDLDLTHGIGGFLESLEEVPVIGDIVKAITGSVHGTMATLENWFDNVKSFLAGINFNITHFDPLAAAEDFIDAIIAPVGKLAQVIGGFISSAIIPGLDASKIISGLFPQNMIAGLQGVLNDIGGRIQGAVDDLGELIYNLLHNPGQVLGQISQALVSGLNGALNTINSAVTSIQSFAQNILDGIITAIGGIPVVGGTLAKLLKTLTGYKATTDAAAVNNQNYTITVSSTGSYRNPSWVCRYPLADVVFPEFMLAQLPVFGVTGPASTGTAHTHVMDSGTSNAEVGSWNVPQNTARGGYLTATNTIVYDTVGIGVFKDTGTLNNVFCEIFREAPDGSLVQLFSKEFSSQISTAGGYVEFTLPTPIVAQAGERYTVRVRNASTVATTVWCFGTDQIDWAVDMSAYWNTASTANKTSYTAAEAASARATSTAGIWALLAAKSTANDDRSYTDNFDRMMLGSLWFRNPNNTSKLDIYNNMLGFTGSTDPSQEAIYINATNRDVSRVDVKIVRNAAAPGVRLGPILHANREFTQMVYLGVGDTDAKIYSIVNGTVTERASHPITEGDGTWTLYFDGNNYVAMQDGVLIGLQWSGAGSAVTHGFNYRYAGARIESSGGNVAGSLDEWTLRDWSVAVAATVVAPPMTSNANLVGTVKVAGPATIKPARMSASGSMTKPHVGGGVYLAVTRMVATGEMKPPSTSSNNKFPYVIPFKLG